jgi:hypothetical protein
MGSERMANHECNRSFCGGNTMNTKSRLARHFLRTALVVAVLGLGASVSMATIFTEGFEGPFPAWESGWFGLNSDARNWNCGGALGCASRGNNPDGLWVASVGGGSSVPIEVNFNASFGAEITSLVLDVAGYKPTTFSVFDMGGLSIFSQAVVLTLGAYTDPGTYSHYTIDSTNGISRFAFSGEAAGNTSIDNLVVNSVANPIPEPEIYALLAAGLSLMGYVARRRKRNDAAA